MGNSTLKCSRCFRRPPQPPYFTCAKCRDTMNKSRKKGPTFQSSRGQSQSILFSPQSYTLYSTNLPPPSKRRRLDNNILQSPNQYIQELSVNSQSDAPLSVSPMPPLSAIDESITSPHLIFQTRAVPLSFNRAQKRRLQRITPLCNGTQQLPQPVPIPHRNLSPKEPNERPDIDLYSDDSEDAESRSDIATLYNNGNENSISSTQSQSRTVTRARERPRRPPKAFASEYHQVKAHDLGLMEHICQYCGAIHWLAERSKKSSNTNLCWQRCCQNGEVNLPLMPDPPPFLRHLFEDNDPTSKHFRQNSRRYNAALAFTSLSYTEDERLANLSWIQAIPNSW